MDASDNLGKLCIKEFAQAQSSRFNFEAQWQDIRELVRTNTSDFNRNATQGDRRSENIFDGTAPWALEQFAAGIHSSMSSPTERWFNVTLADQDGDLDDDSLMWLELVSDAIFKEYAKPQVNLASPLHEVYQDLGGFGTGVLYQDWNWESGHVHFRSFPLADCYIKESAQGIVNCMMRLVKMTVQQIMDEFTREGDYIPPKLSEEKNLDKVMEVIHWVEPRSIERVGFSATRKKFKSCWVLKDLKCTLRERGYDEFPYHVPRWTKLAGEMYGRSPAMTCLPDIKMLNTMSKVVIKAGQKIVDPPLIVPDDGFMLPIKTSPGSLIFKTAGQEDTIQPLVTNARVDIGLDMMEQRREHIIKSFYVDWILRQKKRERQTATEVMDDRNEMLRQMAPMVGRLTVELLSPMVIRTYNLLSAAGRIPIAPQSLERRQLNLSFVSPAAKAQYGSKAAGIQMFIQDLAQMTPVNQEVTDNIDVDALAQEMAKVRDVTRKVIRSPDQVSAIRENRAKQQQAASAVAMGSELAGAAKDISVAKKNGLGQ
jgi:hypothetical protein